MLPKIEAALDFVKGDDKRKAIITSIENLENIDKEANCDQSKGVVYHENRP